MAGIRAAGVVSAVILVTASIHMQAQAPRIVRAGDRALLAARMPLTTDTIDAFVVSNGVREPGSTTIRSITRQQEGTEPVYEIRTVNWTPQGDTTVATMRVRVKDLALVFHRVTAAHDSAAVTASSTHLTGWVVLPNTPISLLDRTLPQPVFGVEGQVPWLLPLLPLEAGYRALVPHFSPWAGEERWDTVTVVGAERVVLGGRAIDCWKVDTGHLGPPGYRMYRWIDRKSRRVTQSALLGGSGGREYWSYLRP